MIKLPSFISSGMVITKNAALWGWSEPHAEVRIVFKNKEYIVTADASGRFDLTTQSESFGGPYELIVGEHVIHDVYVGRVLLMGGQSNMEGPLERCRLRWAKDIVPDSRIKMFQVQKGLKFDGTADDVIGSWRNADTDMGSLYAVPYFFARKLLEDDYGPIGLLCNPAGGTPIEGWLPEDIVKNHQDLYPSLQEVQTPGFIDNETERGNKRVQAWHETLSLSDQGLIESWESFGVDDHSWSERMLFDRNALPKHGVVWYRKTWVLDDADVQAASSQDVFLNFGRAENSIKIYLNGTLVTSVDYMYPPCNAVIPSALLRRGKNVLCVRIVGDSSQPMLVPGKEYTLTIGTKIWDLTGIWKYKIGKEMPQLMGGAWFYGRPCGVYNHMMAGLLGYSVDGIIWYQGESNTGRPKQYQALFTQFVDHMRAHFGDVPVIFTQLANYIDPSPGCGENWAMLRDAQRQCLSIVNTAMAVTIDCGEFNDLHPADKKTVGERLARHAQRLVYLKDIVSDGPQALRAVLIRPPIPFEQVMVQEMVFVVDENVQKTKLVVEFEHAAGLWANGYVYLDVLDTKGMTHKVYAQIAEEQLIAEIPNFEPARVRFGFDGCPAVTLYNAYNLPASPFELYL